MTSTDAGAAIMEEKNVIEAERVIEDRGEHMCAALHGREYIGGFQGETSGASIAALI